MRTDRKTKVKIGCRDYTISFHEDLKGLQGECLKEFSHDHEKGWIKVKKGMAPVDKGNTMLHEIIHAVFTERGLIFSENTEEKIVLAMTNGLVDFIRVNPKFFARLVKLLGVEK